MLKKILLADDHAVVREGLENIIRKYTTHRIVAAVGDGLETIEQVRSKRPDLVILDIGMQGVNGLEAIGHIRKIDPNIKILVLSMYVNKQLIISAIKAGAMGYLVKDGAVDELVKAMEIVFSGKRYISPSLSDILAEEIISPGDKGDGDHVESLSSRERQILSLIACGDSRTEIAKKLHISLETVKSHRKKIMLKLNLHKHSELVKYALKNKMGLIA